MRIEYRFLVGGPGFERRASRSRNLGGLVHRDRFRWPSAWPGSPVGTPYLRSKRAMAKPLTERQLRSYYMAVVANFESLCNEGRFILDPALKRSGIKRS